MDISNLKIVDVGNLFGTMNSSSIRLSNITASDKEMIMRMNGLSSLNDDYKFTSDDKRAIFLAHRIALAGHYGFDFRKMFMADQKDKKGTYFVLDRDYVDANPNGWSDIDEDILIIREDVPGVVAGHPIADCPVIVMEDNINGVTAVAHCSAELIDKRLPMLMADALLDYSQTRDEDISVYVSACAGKNWTYEGIPSWLDDMDMWLDACGIKFDEDIIKNGIVTPKMHIILRNAIKAQLMERNIEEGQILFSDIDTITNPNYYSNSASSVHGLNQEEKFGRNFAGAFYPKVKLKVKTK